MARWRVRSLAIICLISLLLSVTIISEARVEAYGYTCLSPNALPTVVGTPIVPSTGQPSVVLNEILPSPHFAWNCASQTTSNPLQNAWVELYNLGDQPLDLYAGRALIDTGPNTPQYPLPIGSVIPARSFFTFFPYLSDNHYSVSLFPTVRLLLDYVPVDQVNLPPLPNDVSYARIPDGTGKWQQSLTPTINSSNSITLSPSSTPTHLSTKHTGKSKNTVQGKKKYARSTKAGNSDTASQTIASTDVNGSDQIQNDTGKQTQWHSLQFPSSLASPSALSTTEDTSSIPSSPSAPTENVSQKILFSMIGIAGLLSLWWGWRRFFKKRRQSEG